MFKKCVLINAIIIALFTLTACSKDENTEIKDNFVKSCAKNGVTKQTCACIYSGLENAYTTEKLVQYIKTQDFPDDINRVTFEAAKVCVE